MYIKVTDGREMMFDYKWAYEQIKDHYLEELPGGNGVRCFYMRKAPDTRMMSVFLIFSPEGIVITGDLHPGKESVSGQNGVIGLVGYDLGWFVQDLSDKYLASKFLNQTWIMEHYVEQVRELLVELREEENDLLEPPQDWDVGGDVLYGTEADAIEYYLTFMDKWGVSTYKEALDFLPAGCCVDNDEEFVAGGYGYDPTELGWLVAIQQKFRELYTE